MMSSLALLAILLESPKESLGRHSLSVGTDWPGYIGPTPSMKAGIPGGALKLELETCVVFGRPCEEDDCDGGEDCGGAADDAAVGGSTIWYGSSTATLPSSPRVTSGFCLVL